MGVADPTHMVHHDDTDLQAERAIGPARSPRRSRIAVGAAVAAAVFALACASDEASDGGSTSDGGGSETSSDESSQQAASDAACKDTADDVELDTVDQSLYPGRADTQASDHEAAVGDCVRISGLTAFVDGAKMVTPEFGDPQLIVTVTERNRSDEAQAYNLFDWKIQTAEGQVLDPTIPFGTDTDLGSGDLVPGGTVSGDVAFDVAPGTYFVIWKPSPFDDARGIWQVTV